MKTTTIHTRKTASRTGTVQVIDVQSVTVNHPDKGVKSFARSKSKTTVRCDVLIAGGGLGGVAAALRASQNGLYVCLTEETDWLGGQATAQGVSALDENRYVETSGATRQYQVLRTAIRDHYRSLCASGSAAAADTLLNPGSCWVSPLSFEPSVALAEIDKLLAPAQSKGDLTVFKRTKPVFARVSGKKVKAITFVNLDDGSWLEVKPKICLDATELGDLLPLTGLPYRCGSESHDLTGEPHAPAQGDPDNVQDFTYPFVLDFRAGEDHTIAKPARYEIFKENGMFSFYGYKMFEPSTRIELDGSATTLMPFWEYRRLIDKASFDPAKYPFDVAMINWMSNDLRGENILDKAPYVIAQRLALGKALSLGFLYWLQTEAPRDDGGQGYPELALRLDVLGSPDGLSKYPYIRESRRIVALKTIVEQDIASAFNTTARARLFDDSVGIGWYPIDIHGHQEVPGTGQSSKPFQIPLSAMLSGQLLNFMPCAKNIGTTHVTNGAYRLHPIEWAIGEAAGTLAAFCLKHKTKPPYVMRSTRRLRSLQLALLRQGIPIYWFDDVPTTHPDFEAIQFVSVAGIMPLDADSLHFNPDQAIKKGDAAQALIRLLKNDLAASAEEALQYCRRWHLIRSDESPVDGPLSWEDLIPAGIDRRLNLTLPSDVTATPSRSEFVRWLFSAARSRLL